MTKMVAQTKERRKGSKRENNRLKSPIRSTKKAMTKTFWRVMVIWLLTGTPLSRIILPEESVKMALTGPEKYFSEPGEWKGDGWDPEGLGPPFQRKGLSRGRLLDIFPIPSIIEPHEGPTGAV